jgi:hypothetical protein
MGFEKKKKNNPKEDSSRSDGGDAGSVVTTSRPVPQVKVKSMAIMMIGMYNCRKNIRSLMLKAL